MANNTARYGFRLHHGGGVTSPPPVECTVATGYQATNDGAGFSVGLSVGDPVNLVSTGTVALALTTTAVWGVIVGVKQYWDGSKLVSGKYVPGATAWGTIEDRRTILLVQRFDPLSVWAINVNDNTTATTEAGYRAFLGENCTHTCPGDNTTDSSKPTANPKMSIATHATTASLVFRLVGISPTSQDFTGTGVELLVRANISQDAGQAATTIAGV